MVKNPPANARDTDSILGSGRSPEERNDKPLQHSYMSNPMDTGAWWATVHRAAKSDITEVAFTHACRGFPCGSVVKNPPANARDTVSTPG